MTLWTQVKTDFFFLVLRLMKWILENICHVSIADGVLAPVSRRALPQDVLNLFFHPLQELSVELYAQLEKDAKGSEEETSAEGSYRSACIHKVCHFTSFLKGTKRLRPEKGSNFSVPVLAPILLFRPRSFCVQCWSLEQATQEHLECWTIAGFHTVVAWVRVRVLWD